MLWLYKFSSQKDRNYKLDNKLIIVLFKIAKKKKKKSECEKDCKAKEIKAS